MRPMNDRLWALNRYCSALIEQAKNAPEPDNELFDRIERIIDEIRVEERRQRGFDLAAEMATVEFYEQEVGGRRLEGAR